jgi:hypothetical protein
MDRFHAGFLKSIGLIKDYLPHLVIAGGWAPFVYYRYLVALQRKYFVDLCLKSVYASK